MTPRVTHPKQGSPVASPKQVVLLDEFLITVVAVEWFFTSVNPFMHSQVVLLDERYRDNRVRKFLTLDQGSWRKPDH